MIDASHGHNVALDEFFHPSPGRNNPTSPRSNNNASAFLQPNGNASYNGQPPPVPSPYGNNVSGMMGQPPQFNNSGGSAFGQQQFNNVSYDRPPSQPPMLSPGFLRQQQFNNSGANASYNAPPPMPSNNASGFSQLPFNNSNYAPTASPQSPQSTLPSLIDYANNSGAGIGPQQLNNAGGNASYNVPAPPPQQPSPYGSNVQQPQPPGNDVCGIPNATNTVQDPGSFFAQPTLNNANM